MIVKLHHALLDGPSGAELMVQLLDAQPESGHAPRRPGRLDVDPEPSRAELERVAWRRAVEAPRAATEMRKAIDVLAAVRQWDLEHPEVAVPGTFGAPRTPFNQPISAGGRSASPRRRSMRRQAAP